MGLLDLSHNVIVRVLHEHDQVPVNRFAAGRAGVSGHAMTISRFRTRGDSQLFPFGPFATKFWLYRFDLITSKPASVAEDAGNILLPICRRFSHLF